ncbi:BAG family molecular chaperone regulator 6 [Forsythia ovata]|uniref:BAG family molecular chaperone regulator 6 n=1 Tax=Forsythia ovata TaxID=205694 RepID=A0ABD1U719_9LAMI
MIFSVRGLIMYFGVTLEEPGWRSYSIPKSSQQKHGEVSYSSKLDDKKDIWENQTDERSTEEKPSTECTRADKADVKVKSDDNGSHIVKKEELSRGKEVIANEVEEPKRKKLTDLEAAIIIQSAYRGFAIRRREPLKKLKQISKVLEQIVVIKLLIQDMESSSDIRRDNKEIHMVGEEITQFLCT